MIDQVPFVPGLERFERFGPLVYFDLELPYPVEVLFIFGLRAVFDLRAWTLPDL